MATRRTFLQTTTASLFTGGVAPAILGAADKADAKRPVIGEGDFQFECHHNWGSVPKHITWRNTHGVAIDREGFVYITHQGDVKSPCDTVVVFDPEGTFVRSFGKEFAGGGHGIDIRRENEEEYLYLSDIYNRQVIKCDRQGEWVWKKRYPRDAHLYSSLEGFRPTNVCFGPSGDLYVGDGYGSHLIHQYNSDGKWIGSWGGNGAQAGKLKTPHGLWLDARPGREQMLVVADRANARLQYFSLDGQPVEILQGVRDPEKSGETTTLKDEAGRDVAVKNVDGLSFPADIDTWEEFMVVPDLHSRVLLFDTENNLLANLGGDPEWTEYVLDGMQVRKQPDKWKPGKFVHPHDACFDEDGNMIVTEWVEAGRVTKLEWV